MNEESGKETVSYTLLRGVNLAKRTQSDCCPSPQMAYYHFDGLGSVVAVTDQGANLVNDYRYDAFGATLSGGDDGNALQFVGALGVRNEGAIRLIYVRNRWFMPSVGIFTSYDPIGHVGDLNLYRYVKNNPVLFADPYGLKIFPSDYKGPIGPNDQIGLTIEQFDALQKLLEREKKFGFRRAAQMSSITFGDKLLEPFNSSYGHTVPSPAGNLDLDWFTDIAATSYLGRYSVLPLYVIGKLAWSLTRELGGLEPDNFWPFQDPGERAAFLLLIQDFKYSDLFTEKFFEVYGPQLPCE